MKIFTSKHEMQAYLEPLRNSGAVVGFTPTLGALHAGHASLIKKSIEACDISVCSIFVNPTQFNEKSDLDKYPRTYEADVALLEEVQCDILFYPSENIVYPSGQDYEIEVDLAGLNNELEGEFRPGHFEGVVQVVHRLLELVEPDKLYMGQKDFQQFTIINRMIEAMDLPVELVVCPIKREATGLAMSSRNERLASSDRSKARLIYKTIQDAKKWIKKETISSCKNKAMEVFKDAGFEPEYFEFIDGNTLKKVDDKDATPYLVIVTAVWVAGIRLIDNEILKS